MRHASGELDEEGGPFDYLSVPFCVSLNGGAEACAGNASFVYYNTSSVAHVSTMHPRAGPVAGGTVLTVSGLGFLDLGGGGEGLHCLFGSPDDPSAALAPATLLQLLHPNASVPPGGRNVDQLTAEQASEAGVPTAALPELYGTPPPVAGASIGAASSARATLLQCTSPPWSQIAADSIVGDSPQQVAVHITLNGDRASVPASEPGLSFTYFEL